MNSQRLAYVVLSYDHPQITKTCVKSLMGEVGASLFLVHNGSLPKNVMDLKAEFPNVRHLEFVKNLGFAGGANGGLKAAFEAGAEWVVFVTNDCQLQAIGALPSRPGMYAPKIFRRNTGQVDSLGGGFSPKKGHLQHLKSEQEWTSLARKGILPYIPATAFLIHREIFEATGGFDEDLFTYWEDVDLSLRLHSPFQIGLVPDWVFRHGVGKTCHGKSLYSIYYFQRNRIRVSLRNLTPSQRIVTVGFFGMDVLRRSFKMALRGRLREVPILLRALRDV